MTKSSIYQQYTQWVDGLNLTEEDKKKYNKFHLKMYWLVIVTGVIPWDHITCTFKLDHNSDELKHYLGALFKHNNPTSFIRQLNMYGFTRSRIGAGFSHPGFTGRFSDMVNIVRKTNPRQINTKEQQVTVTATRKQVTVTATGKRKRTSFEDSEDLDESQFTPPAKRTKRKKVVISSFCCTVVVNDDDPAMQVKAKTLDPFMPQMALPESLLSVKPLPISQYLDALVTPITELPQLFSVSF